MADTIITGVISNFIFASISAATPEKLRRLTPALFYGGKAALEAADTAFLNAKDEILDKFGKRMEVVRFLSPEKTLHGGVLNPLFENIFHHKPLNTKALDQAFRSCFDNPRATRNQNYDYIVDEIIDTVRRHLLSDKRTAPFVIQASIDEIKTVIKSVESVNNRISEELTEYASVKSEDEQVDKFSKLYLSELKEFIERVFIYGLDIKTKKDINHLIKDAFVPVRVDDIRENETHLNREKAPRINALDVVRKVPKAIFRGPAGCGKTTLMQWIIVSVRPTPSVR